MSKLELTTADRQRIAMQLYRSHDEVDLAGIIRRESTDPEVAELLRALVARRTSKETDV